MLIKTSELSGAALDWAVQMAMWAAGGHVRDDNVGTLREGAIAVAKEHQYSTNWAQGGPLIDKFDVWLSDDECEHIASTYPHVNEYIATGPTKLIAACRAIVAAKLGNEVEVPDELLSAQM